MKPKPASIPSSVAVLKQKNVKTVREITSKTSPLKCLSMIQSKHARDKSISPKKKSSSKDNKSGPKCTTPSVQRRNSQAKDTKPVSKIGNKKCLLASKSTHTAKKLQQKLQCTKNDPPRKCNRKTKSASESKSCVKNKKSFTELMDLWTLSTFGKREASLNASMKVNILYESQSSSKSPQKSPAKSPSKVSPNKSSEAKTSTKDDELHRQVSQGIKNKGSPKSKSDDSHVEKTAIKKVEGLKLRNTSKNTLSGISVSRKRKAPIYKIFKDAPPNKSRKVSKSQQQRKSGSSYSKKSTCKKPSTCDHQLSNIIERSPRQASLMAKAMIAMEQEEDAVCDLSARSRVYEWTEMRAVTHSERRRIQWLPYLGNSTEDKNSNTSQVESASVKRRQSSTDVSSSECMSASASPPGGKYPHSSVLQTIHHIGDARLLKEYMRAQREDFVGIIDVEKCATPEVTKASIPENRVVTTPLCHEEKSQKSPEKQSSCSPAKPQPCRVATPIPQFPIGQRTSHMTSFIHHPIPQTVYPQHHPHVQQQQPIKVTPYPPNPNYVFQYSLDQQQNMFLPPNQSPMPYNIGGSDLDYREYSSSFTLNHIGSLSLGRRGLNPYQQQAPAYNPSLHLPIQQIGFNFAPIYPSAIQNMPQQNLAGVSPLSLHPHQQFPLVQPSVISPHPYSQNMAQVDPYPNGGFAQYPPLGSGTQDVGCMPPPSAPVPPAQKPPSMGPPLQHPMRRPQPIPHSSSTSVSPMESLKSMNPTGILPIVSSTAFDLSLGSHESANTHRHSSAHSHSLSNGTRTDKDTKNKIFVFSPSKYNMTFNGRKSLPVCKKERDPSRDWEVNCKSSLKECQSKLNSSPAVQNVEGSNVSDLLHSAHSTVYQEEGTNTVENTRSLQEQADTRFDASSVKDASVKGPGGGEMPFNYSVSSILQMPRHKIKLEPRVESSVMSSETSNRPDSKPFQLLIKETSVSADSPTSDLMKGTVNCDRLDVERSRAVEKNEEKDKEETNDESGGISATNSNNCVIVIADSDASSDDEPLAKLVKSKQSHETNANNTADPSVSVNSVFFKATTPEKQETETSIKVSDKIIAVNQGQCRERKVKKKEPTQSCKQVNKKKANSTKPARTNKPKQRIVLQPHQGHNNTKSTTIQHQELEHAAKVTKPKPASHKSSKTKKTNTKTAVSEPQLPPAPPRAVYHHGWSWIGDGEMKPIPKLTMQKEEAIRCRMCYQSMKHTSGEVVSVRDCVILQSDGDGSVPYVAKVSSLWENLSGEMMFSMVWYYQPEHTAAQREPEDGEQELFASKHREENSVACIDDKCYVLMQHEYCRLEAEAARQDQGCPLPLWRQKMPQVSEEDRCYRRVMPPPDACVDNIWFCRYDYDFRKKIVKKPKHKKANLRYRAPNKLV